MKISYIILSIFLSFNFLNASAPTRPEAIVDIGDHTDAVFLKRLSDEVTTTACKLVVTNLTRTSVKVSTIYGVKECFERYFDSGFANFELRSGQSAIINDIRFAPLKNRSFITIEINDRLTFNCSDDKIAALGALVRYFVPDEEKDEEKRD